MAFSFNYKHTTELQREKSDSKAGHIHQGLSASQLWVLAGSGFLGLLLLWSWSLDNLFMTELLSVSFIWMLVCLVKLQSGPNSSHHEKR